MAGLAGCGGSSPAYRNAERPAAPIVLSASIDDRAVSVSPAHLGAGPVTLVITNQSMGAQQITLETVNRPGSGPGEKAVQTGPINPRETASVQAEVKQGTYTLHVGGDGVRAARIVVGRPRPSSQNDLLQP
ncbi:hypothetical protein FSW04_11655 [Baekduia soli]|uniref:Uncharacterized protein n=1 Tax=Baekduia soli TaxID=496014 RepID=A0A5B8U5N9_9ACTN|nr:hypothetical protein [Baekduia soli]QEC48158.1 hypothetical protein FSW04_11655 [Baekduia soli]